MLTGSANLMTIPTVADSLAGRMEVIRLLPLAQAEIRGGKGIFLENAFSGKSLVAGEPQAGKELVAMVLAGGYPEALERTRWRRRQAWYSNYIDAIVQRDVREIARIEQLSQVPRLLGVLAEYAGQLVNYSRIGAPLGMNHVTTRKYVGILESLFLASTVQPWRTNRLKRLIRSPKLHFLDSGLLAALRGISPERVERDKTLFGPILETFVFGELLKLASWGTGRFSLSHFRDKDGNEVDFVIENRRGEIVGIEVKAAATVTSSDFSGLRKLSSACGDNFVQGMVLYDNDQLVPFGNNLFAVPFSCLWA